MGGHLELLGFPAFLYCSHCLWGSFFPLPREPHSILWTLDDHVVARLILFSHLEPQPCLLPRTPTADISGWSLLLYRTHTAVFPGKALTLTFLGNTNVTIPDWGSSCSLQNSISCFESWVLLSLLWGYQSFLGKAHSPLLLVLEVHHPGPPEWFTCLTGRVLVYPDPWYSIPTMWRPGWAPAHCSEKWHFSTRFIYFHFTDSGVLPTCMSTHPIHAVPVEARRGHHILWHCSYRHLLTATWVMEIKPRSSRRPGNDLHYRAIPAALPSGILTSLTECLYGASACYSGSDSTCPLGGTIRLCTKDRGYLLYPLGLQLLTSELLWSICRFPQSEALSLIPELSHPGPPA